MVINVEVIARTFRSLWRTRKGFQFREARDHTLLFIFEVECDAQKILWNESWSFDKHPVVFTCYDQKTPIENLEFAMMKFWVQLHNLLIMNLSYDIAE